MALKRRQFPLGLKLAAGFSIVVALLITLGIVSISRLDAIKRHADAFSGDIVPAMTDIGSLDSAAQSLRRDQYRHVVAETPADKASVEKDIAVDRATAEKAIARYGRLIGDDKSKRAALTLVTRL